MSFQSFRSFIETLAEKGQLVTIADEIYPEPDVRTYLRAAADVGDQGPAPEAPPGQGFVRSEPVGGTRRQWLGGSSCW